MPLLLLTALAPAAWGTTYAVTTELLPPDRPLTSGALRALPAGVLLLALTRRLPRGDWWWRSLALSTLNISLFFTCLFVSAYRLPGGLAAVLGAVQPLLVAGLAAALLAEAVTRRTLLAGGLGVGGVGLVALTGTALPDPVGVAAGLAGAASMALGVVLTRRWGQPAPPLVTTSWQLVAGGTVLVPLALLFEGAPPALDHAALAGYAYLTLVGGALSYVLWFRGLARMPVTHASLLGLLAPVVAAVVGWAVLGQALGLLQLTGLAVVVGAIALGTRHHRTAVRADPRPVHARAAPARQSGGPAALCGSPTRLDEPFDRSPNAEVWPQAPEQPR